MDNLLDRFTSHFKQVLIRAQNVAWQKGAPAIEPLHLLYALLLQRGSIAAEILQKQGLKPDNLQLNLNGQPNVKKMYSADPWDLPQPNPVCQRMIEQAVKSAYEFNHKYIGSEHLLASLLNNNDRSVQSVFLRYNIDGKKMSQQLELILRGTAKFNDWQKESGDLQDFDKVMTADNSGRGESALDNYTRSEEHTSELPSHVNLVCRLLL